MKYSWDQFNKTVQVWLQSSKLSCPEKQWNLSWSEYHSKGFHSVWSNWIENLVPRKGMKEKNCL